MSKWRGLAADFGRATGTLDNRTARDIARGNDVSAVVRGVTGSNATARDIQRGNHGQAAARTAGASNRTIREASRGNYVSASASAMRDRQRQIEQQERAQRREEQRQEREQAKQERAEARAGRRQPEQTQQNSRPAHAPAVEQAPAVEVQAAPAADETTEAPLPEEPAAQQAAPVSEPEMAPVESAPAAAASVAPSEPAVPESSAAPVAESAALNASEVKLLQSGLRLNGIDAGPVDGIAGPMTNGAMADYIRQNPHLGLSADDPCGVLAALREDMQQNPDIQSRLADIVAHGGEAHIHDAMAAQVALNDLNDANLKVDGIVGPQTTMAFNDHMNNSYDRMLNGSPQTPALTAQAPAPQEPVVRETPAVSSPSSLPPSFT